MVKCSLSMHKALGSIPSIKQTKKQEEEEEYTWLIPPRAYWEKRGKKTYTITWLYNSFTELGQVI